MEHATGERRGLGFSTIMLGFLTAGLFWAYWPTLTEMAERWEHEPQYSHGYLVPLFSLVVLWGRRKALLDSGLTGRAWGLAIVLAATVLRLAGTYFHYVYLDPISLLPASPGWSCCTAAGRPCATPGRPSPFSAS